MRSAAEDFSFYMNVREFLCAGRLTLALFVLFDGAADDHHFAVTTNDTTIDAARFNRSANLHDFSVIFRISEQSAQNCEPKLSMIKCHGQA